ncbi:MAG: lipoate--protein ligase [Tissierellia bacterium]|nr:lipoate--protein ligase [Tissierellia bacterium]
MKYVESHSFNPAYNLSFEEFIFKKLPLEEDETYVYLWQNAPAVIIGKHQNAWAEINKDFLDQKGVHLIRRITGGGAVYHDLGNLNFSFITRDKSQGKIDFSSYYQPILEVLRDMGAPAQLSGRNDITVQGQKILGASQSIWKGRVLSNGCILFDVDLDQLAQALRVRPEKLETKGVQSVKARVTNVKPYLKEGTSVEDFKAQLLQALFKRAGQDLEEYILSPEEKNQVLDIMDQRFGKAAWNWGQSPKASYKQGKKFPYAWIEVAFDIKKGALDQVLFQGDFFGTQDPKDLEEALEGQPYDKEALKKALAPFDLEAYFGKGACLEDLLSLF